MEKANFERIKSLFDKELLKVGYEGVVGAAKFERVYHDLMPLQKSKLENICGDRFQSLMKNGSIVCLGIAYTEHAIDCIDVKLNDGRVDKKTWNIYAREYHKLNNLLNNISKDIASRFDSIPIPATTEGIIVKNVEEYYGMTVSHRVVAENAGLG